MEQKTFKLESHGATSEVYFKLEKYHDGPLAVQLIVVDPGGWSEPFATVSVNVKRSKLLAPDEFYLKDWTENAELAYYLVEHAYIETVTRPMDEETGASAYRLTEKAKPFVA